MMATRADLRGSRVLVTGASGFIGTRLCSELLARGSEVHGVSRVVREYEGLRWWVADAAETDHVLEVMRAARPDVVFHLASHVSGSRALENVLPATRSNFLSTLNVLLGAADVGCRRVVLAGSLEEPDENGDQTPVSPYAAAKFAASSFAQMFHRLYAAPVVTLRLFMVYGPGQQDETKLVPYVITSFLRSEAPHLSSGTRPVDWIFVDDVVDAFLAAAVVDGIDGKTFDVGSGALATVRDVVEEIATQMKPAVGAEFGAIEDRSDERVRVANLPPTRDEIGWAPRTSLPDGIAATIDWYSARSVL
jgi:nucleoside-diphosphate-sugar epimerase